MSCCVCQKSKTGLVCGLCKEDVCKPCTEFLEADSFSFLKKKPEHLATGAFCVTCFNNTISAELAEYEAKLEQAKNILVFDTTQGKETRFIKRKEAQLKVVDCPDRDETIMRLAFFAVELGYNALVDVDLKSKKIKDGKHQHLIWTGTAIPTNVTDKKLLKDRSLWSNPN